MDSFNKHLIKQEYDKLAKLGDRLAKANQLVDWEAFRPIIRDLYQNDSEQGGRPNHDEVLMVKLLVAQQWYGLSDKEAEREAVDRLSFRHFLGYPDVVPDSTTIWFFRERLAKTGKDKLIWAELQRQLDEKGLRVRKGVAQDASFITADPGQSSGKPRGGDALTRRSRASFLKIKRRFYEFVISVPEKFKGAVGYSEETRLGFISHAEVDAGVIYNIDLGFRILGEPSGGTIVL